MKNVGGYVYLIADEDETVYKIGVTRNIKSKRLKALQTGNKSKLKMVNNFFCDYPFRLEKMLHRHFHEYEELGEWFSLSKEMAEEFINLCEKYNETIKALSENPFFMKNIH